MNTERLQAILWIIIFFVLLALVISKLNQEKAEAPIEQGTLQMDVTRPIAFPAPRQV